MKVNRAWCSEKEIVNTKEYEMNNLSLMFAAMLVSTASAFSVSSSDAWLRNQAMSICRDWGSGALPVPQEENRMGYHVVNSSGSRITALYFKGADMDSWSGNCLADPATLTWINNTALYVGKSSRRHGAPKATLCSSVRQRDLNGNWWSGSGSMTVDVPLDGYDGNAYHMKVVWEDGTVRKFYLPYPAGNVTIYENHLNVYLSARGRGLFYKARIDAL